MNSTNLQISPINTSNFLMRAEFDKSGALAQQEQSREQLEQQKELERAYQQERKDIGRQVMEDEMRERDREALYYFD